MKAMGNSAGADFGALRCSTIWSFLILLTGERGQELMGLPLASVLCSKRLFSNPSRLYCTALMYSPTETFHLAEGVDSFYLHVSCFNQQEGCSAIPGSLSVL